MREARTSVVLLILIPAHHDNSTSATIAAWLCLRIAGLFCSQYSLLSVCCPLPYLSGVSDFAVLCLGGFLFGYDIGVISVRPGQLPIILLLAHTRAM